MRNSNVYLFVNREKIARKNCFSKSLSPNFRIIIIIIIIFLKERPELNCRCSRANLVMDTRESLWSDRRAASESSKYTNEKMIWIWIAHKWKGRQWVKNSENFDIYINFTDGLYVYRKTPKRQIFVSTDKPFECDWIFYSKCSLCIRNESTATSGAHLKITMK